MRAALGISDKSVTDHQIAGLAQFLTARNQVAHDLDIKAPGDASWGPRYQRRIKTVVAQCDSVLAIAGAFVDAVSDELGGPPPLGRPRGKKS